MRESLRSLMDQVTHLREVFENFRCTVSEDAPEPNALAEREANHVDDAIGHIDAMLHALRQAVKPRMISRRRAAAILATCGREYEQLLRTYFEPPYMERLKDLLEFPGDHGPQWQPWLDCVCQARDETAAELVATFTSLSECWQQVSGEVVVKTRLRRAGPVD